MSGCIKRPLLTGGLVFFTFCAAATASDTTTDSRKLNSNAVSVAESLKTLMHPSEQAARLREMANMEAEPSYQIVKGRNDRATLVYRCRFTQARSLLNPVETMLSAHGLVEASPEQNILVINDHVDKMEELKEALIAMDTSAPQVLVEAKVVEVLMSDGVQRDLSVMWNRYDTRQKLSSHAGTQTSVPNQAAADKNQGADVDWFPVVAGGIGDSNYSNLQVAMQWLMSAEDAKVLSAPNVIVSRNSTASIVTGNDIPIQTIQVVSGSTTTSTDFKRIGVQLNVTPSLINDDYVTLRVNPQVSNVQRYENIKQGETNYPVPVIAIRNIETQLTLRDGQVIMLGGLYSSRDINAQQRTPFLSDIPLIGDLFTGKNVSREITQLIFFLKVSILTQKDIADGIIYDPGEQAEELRKAGEIIHQSTRIFPRHIDSTQDKIEGVMRYEDGDGNIELLGARDKRPVPSETNKEQESGKSGDETKEAAGSNKYAF